MIFKKQLFKLPLAITLLGLVALYLAAFKPADDPAVRAQLATVIEKSIKTEMLNKWYPQAVDKEAGGFLSTFSYDWKPVGEQDKMVVTQARHIWSNSKAAQLYPDVDYYLPSAKHGVAFLRDKMWDKTSGGFFTLVDRQGNVKEQNGGYAGGGKNAYGNAFAIYALAAYYQASGDTSALNLAKKTFRWLEKYSHDPVNKGYYQTLADDGTPIQRTSEVPSTSDVGYKDQNSSIHLLEAFSELYLVWPDPLVRERLQEMLVLIRDTLVNPKGYLTLFFTPDWQPVSFRDSSEAAIDKHHTLDEVSFGHDIETAYLLLEASHILGLPHDTKTMAVAKKLTDHTIRNGFDNKTGGFYDAGYYFKDKTGITIIKDSKNWWAQAEGLNTLLLMADHFPKDSLNYFSLFQKEWNYINKYIIDHEHGEWFMGGIDKEPDMKTAQKGQIWKASYHQFRSLSNIVQRLRPDKTAPVAPKNLKKSGTTTLVLHWDKSTDNRNLIGYNLYQNGKKIGFTPLTSFAMANAPKLKGSKITIKAIDYQGNQSAVSAAITL
ncbi:N-acylglucosamine 2-epimerase [Adhaeribacter arboris]|uniref:N-acylglucosamine 2-epimerase n=1 Tax=Adhaeribacter arboris TaxID=2072846 RepID=A0A2T2YM73_9BACT|nr:AGE family epimerase/isomerase [Adhaeribacter arboris]PSR56575.1 N-acylglucosamine 2-epimerase [Adhaeribacter arboris]